MGKATGNGNHANLEGGVNDAHKDLVAPMTQITVGSYNMSGLNMQVRPLIPMMKSTVYPFIL
ncbi:hypothetical protein FSB73_05365 [Arachidicoccus ginsenosidivorans]|uniref:Uncharacterized protein n=1 Tax=Arachidicoccus ginsenosidivorans TaxID=496057 RepID=A0A5B8VJQ5_9BACT|nr:hypothetical protein [Arachidicoccus ginsenosidivorans]QEC71192.1 hypothetical protein FSB73_05365 [Arachidicoccus ginsenosidivorans]